MPNTNISTGTDNQADLRADLEILGSEDELSDNLPAEGDEEVNTPPSNEEDAPEKGEETEETPDKEEDKEPKEEDKEPELVRHSRPTVAQVKSKYPNFFKDFPDMRHMLFREGEYSNLFPTIEEARDASERAGDFDRFSELLTSGKKEDFASFLKGVSEGEAGTLTGIAANFLPALYDTDREMYFKVTSPIAESFLRNAYKAAERNGNENLKNAALVISQWGFEDTGFATGEKQSAPLKAKEEAKDPEFEREKTDFYKAKYTDAQSFVNTGASTRMTAEIKRGLDPNGVFNTFTTNLLVKQVMEELGSILEGDTRHMSQMNSLWKQAHKAGFAGNWKDRILATYLSRARAIMPAIRSRVRTEALKGQEQVNTERTKTAEKSANRREIGGGSGSSGQRSNNRPIDSKTIDWSKTSDLDILNDRVTTRK